MGTKLKTFRLPIEIASKLEDLAKSKQYASEAFIVSKALEEFFDSLHKKEEEKPLTFDLFLEQFLGDELSKRHIEFLETAKKEGESLEDVFRKFIEQAGIHPTKEEWKERIKEEAKVDPFKILDPSLCHYRVITEQGEWYCDTKKIPSAVCIKRQERFQYMGRKCTPITKRAPSLRKKPSSNRRFCKRDRVWFSMGEKNCIKCAWLPTECPVKKEALRGQT